MLNGEAEGCSAAERIAEEIKALEAELFGHGRDVVGHELAAKGAIDIGGMAVALQVDRNDLPVLGECGQDRIEHSGGPQTAMQQDQRVARSVNFVIELDTVHGR